MHTHPCREERREAKGKRAMREKQRRRRMGRLRVHEHEDLLNVVERIG